tara:strand:+ start:334 stop:1908 length:1575 start_codon:yes stop_codon:yes gene_type:complete
LNLPFPEWDKTCEEEFACETVNNTQTRTTTVQIPAMHEGQCNTEETRTCPETLCPYHVVKNCVWNTDWVRALDGSCEGHDSEYHSSYMGPPNGDGGGCYVDIDESHKIPDGQAIAEDDIGYKIVYGTNTTDLETALRCYHPDGRVVSVDGTVGRSYEQVKTMCPDGFRLPQTLDEVGATCGSGMNYDGKYLWMDKDFNSIPQPPPPPAPVAPQRGYHVVKNCGYNTGQMVKDETCPGGLAGKDGCYELIDVNDLIQEPVTTTTIGYKVISNSNTTDAETAVRCYTDTPTGSGYQVYSVPGSISKSYTEAKQLCQDLEQDGTNDWRLPQNLEEVGAACGSGMGYDGNYIWMDECFTFDSSVPLCSGIGTLPDEIPDSGTPDTGTTPGSATPGSATPSGRYKLIRNCKWGGGFGNTAPPHGVINEADQVPESETWTDDPHVNRWGYKLYSDPDVDHPDAAMRCVNIHGTSGASYSGVNHSYNDAKEFCISQGMRLPENSQEAAKTCGTGHGHDGRAMWVDENFVFG